MLPRHPSERFNRGGDVVRRPVVNDDDSARSEIHATRRISGCPSSAILTRRSSAAQYILGTDNAVLFMRLCATRYERGADGDARKTR